MKYADYFGIEFLVIKCVEFYAYGLEMDYDLAMEIRNVWRSGGHSILMMALKNANKYLKVSFSNENTSSQNKFWPTAMAQEYRKILAENIEKYKFFNSHALSYPIFR